MGRDTREGFQRFAGYGENAPLDLDLSSAAVARQIAKRMLSPDFDDWSEAVSRVGFCLHPIHLVGSSTTVDSGTGEVLSVYLSDHEPMGTTLTRCGNRRASVCPSCSRVYAADMFHLIRAGVSGGKGVPESVSENPLVFATVTAPSFGHVHGKRDNNRRCDHTLRRSGVSTADPPPASPPTTTRTRCWGSRCAGSATTTLPTSSGSGGLPNCGGGSPSLSSGSSRTGSASRRSGFRTTRRCSTPRSLSTSCAG